jgi:hypothetical protein
MAVPIHHHVRLIRPSKLRNRDFQFIGPNSLKTASLIDLRQSSQHKRYRVQDIPDSY